jgi:hypothetical protein
MRVVVLIGFLLIDMAVGFYDIGWGDGMAVVEEDGLVRTMDNQWPPPPPAPSYP